jgi:hypothetical protein
MERDTRSVGTTLKAAVRPRVPLQRHRAVAATPAHNQTDVNRLTRVIRQVRQDMRPRSLEEPRCHVAVVHNPRMGNLAIYCNSILLLTSALHACGAQPARIQINPQGPGPGRYTYRAIARCM